MKGKTQYYLLLLFTLFSFSAFTQSLDPYEIQRQKINSLLEERSKNFGQYDQSLSARTGIFGMQTKKDIKNSNEILRQIVLNDNQIFRELKVLLEYKNVATEQLQDTFNQRNEQLENYKASIKKLQDQNEVLKIQLSKQKSESSIFSYLSLLLGISIIAVGFMYFRLRKTVYPK